GEERDVLEEDLVLEGLGGGGDDDLLAREGGGDEVGERLAGAGARLDHGVGLVAERGEDDARHLDLLGALLVAGLDAGEPSPGTEDGKERIAIAHSQSAATGGRVSRKTRRVRATTTFRPGESGAGLCIGGWARPISRLARTHHRK